jgi:cation transporter-like permease
MTASLRRLLTPLLYLRIEREDKYIEELVYPLVLLFLSFFVLYLIGWKVTVFGKDGILGAVGGYLQIVSGFYIASLAAVATFNQKNMDLPMQGDAPTLTFKRNHKTTTEKLTRRRFLSFLFGYLSFLSIILFFGGIAANVVAPHTVVAAGKYAPLIKWSFSAVYMFVIYNLLCTTLLGLYYMTERIHRAEAEFVDKK